MVKRILFGVLAVCVAASVCACRATTETPEITSATAGAIKPDAPTAETIEPEEKPTVPGDTTPGEPDLPLEEVKNTDFVKVTDYIPNAFVNLRYAGTDNFTGKVIYGFRDAYLRYGTVKKLMDVAYELEQQGYGLLIWDCYRPVSAQRKLFETFPDPDYVSPPGVGNQNHCRGKAIDLTLYHLDNGAELLMPSEFDDFTAYADRDYSDVPAEAAANSILLQTIMERYGFTGYSGEWWHYNDTDDYPVEENFNPATVR